MELNKLLALDDEPTRHALTPLRLLRGLICMVILVLTAFMMLVYFGFITSMVLRLFSVHFSRKMTSVVFAAWLGLWPFLFEKINNTKLVFSGEIVPENERVLLIANHRTEVDWMYMWDLALRKGSLGYIKYVLKSSLMKLPIFGWAFHILEFIPVRRKWETDEPVMRKILSTLKDCQDPLWLAIFPEGTDFTEQKCYLSQKYAAEHGLPILKHVLVPKTKGFFACVEELRNSLDAVYDVTIGYKPRCPLMLDNVFGLNPSEVHIHIRRLSVLDIPKSEDKVGTWLIDAFCLKDKLLSEFYSTGHFPNEAKEKELCMVKCLANCIAVLTVTGICTYFTLFSSILLKMYVLVASIFLTYATKYRYRPSPVFSSFLSKWFKRENMKTALD